MPQVLAGQEQPSEQLQVLEVVEVQQLALALALVREQVLVRSQVPQWQVSS